jgi:hypothetical protein
MKNIAIVVIVVAILAGAGLYFMSSKPKTPKPPKTDSNTSDQTVVEPPKKPEPRKQSKYYKKPELAPAMWEDFYELSQMKRLNRVTKEMGKTAPMTPEMYAFFKAELFNRDHWDVTRTNMANALVWTRNADNKHPDPDLHEAFITMLEDDTEDPIWRDYSLQFLSENLANSSDPKRVQEVITKFSKGTGSIAGTAMVHMAYQEQYGDLELDDAFNKQLAEQLEHPEVHRDTKLSIICIMGKRKDVNRLPLIRKYAKQDDDIGLKRTAIAAIGTIAESPDSRDSLTADDKALVQAATNHKSRLVQMAAKAAIKKFASDQM